LGGVIGLAVGIAVFALLFLSNSLTYILAFIAALAGGLWGLSESASGLLYFATFPLTAGFFALIGWGVARGFGVSYALRQVPNEKKAFYKVVAEDKGIRVMRRPGLVAYGFLNREFATVFQQMNGGEATTVAESAKGKEGIGAR
jgi:hypothetical protein